MTNAVTRKGVWPRVRVGDICKSVNGRAFKATEWSTQGLPIIRIQNLNRPNAPFNYFEGHVDNSVLVKDGDVLFAWSGTPGTSFGAHIWRGLDAALNQHIFKLEFDRARIDARYLSYALNRNVVDYIAKAQGGVGLAHVTKSKFENSAIPLPSLVEQQQMVDELEKQFSRLDEAVANLQRVKANLKRYAASVVKAAVEGRLVETEASIATREKRSFESGAQLVQRVLEERRATRSEQRSFRAPKNHCYAGLPDLPGGWTWSCMEAVADRVTVGHVGSMKNEYVSSGIPFLRSQNVRANRFEVEGLKYISPEFHASLEKSALSPGDIVVVRSGSVGVSCVIPDSLSVANCSDLVIIKGPRGIDARFGAYYLNSVVESRIAAGRVGVALVHFNTQSVAGLPLPVPPLAEQRRIAGEVDRRLSLVREVAVEVDANLKRAQSLRQAILAKAFSGAPT